MTLLLIYFSPTLFFGPPGAKARPHYNFGITYTREGRSEEAIKEYLRAIQIKPDYADARYNLGAAYDKQGWYKCCENDQDEESYDPLFDDFILCPLN